MPTIEVYKKTLLSFIGKEMGLEELEGLLPAAKAELESLKTFRYAKPKTRQWWGVLLSSIGVFLFSLLPFYSALREGDDPQAVLWGFFSLGLGVFSLWWSGKSDERRLEVGKHGVASISGKGKIFAAWDEVRKVEQFRSKGHAKLRIYFHTSSGDFVVHQRLLQFDAFLGTVKQHVGDRMLPEKKKWRPWRWTCSNCGTKFSRTSCGFCELPL